MPKSIVFLRPYLPIYSTRPFICQSPYSRNGGVSMIRFAVGNSNAFTVSTGGRQATLAMTQIVSQYPFVLLYHSSATYSSHAFPFLH